MSEREAGDSNLSDIRKRYGDEVDPTVDLPAAGADDVSGDVEARSPLAVPSPGERAARYAPDKVIGRGGMAVVFAARDHDLRRTVAMKVLGKSSDVAGGSSAGTLSRFLEEAQVTGQLDHPGVVPVHDLGMDSEGRVFFTMRRVKGRDFKEIIRLARDGEEGWTLARAVGVVVRICEAMAFAHAKGVVHRDLKPSNIMVGPYGEVYVMDWGLAKVRGRKDTRDIRPRMDDSMTLSRVETDRGTETRQSPESALVTLDGAVLGTPAYMSPEQAEGRIEQVGIRSDIYSIGAILYHTLAGDTPYVPPGAKVSPRTILAMVIQGPPKAIHTKNPDAPEELCAICEKAMAREPEQRYESVREMEEDLQAFLEGRVVKAHRTGAVVEFTKWVRRNRGEAIAIAASILILVGASIAFALLQQGHVRETERQNTQLSELNALLKIETDRANEARDMERDARTEAERVADLLQRQLDDRLIEEKIEERERLWPAVPDTVSAMDAWLAEVDAIRDRMVRWREALDTIGEDGDAAQRSFLENLLERNVRLDAVRSDLVHWRKEAEQLRRVTLEEHAEDWERAIRDIAASGLYGGLAIEPQLGLIPLRKNASTGLWEFLHVASGREPVGVPTTEDPEWLRVDPKSGIVLVLLPPGEFWMGSSGENSRDPNPDPFHKEDESPVTRVRLDAFFIGKHEVTQAQWQRVFGTNPSEYRPGRFEIPVTMTHPVESVTWRECREFLRRVDLDLPTEAQWEYACRAGTDTAFFTGDAIETLEGYANIGDLDYFEAIERLQEAMTYTPIRDGHFFHSPVATYLPNRFGLYDTHGNVWEWCVDRLLPYAIEPRRGDGYREAEGSPEARRVIRGGGFGMVAEQVRSAQRLGIEELRKGQGIGLRAARPVR